VTTQHLVIHGWLPEPLSNGPHGHWSQRQKKLQSAQIMVWASARHARLQPIKGRVCCTVTLVFGVKRRRDTDNLYARVKGVVDGLVKGGFIEEDNTDMLDLRVRAETRPGERATEITLEALTPERV
jgi:Holliday junction resolvase RusA-like endonuclease